MSIEVMFGMSLKSLGHMTCEIWEYTCSIFIYNKRSQKANKQ